MFGLFTKQPPVRQEDINLWPKLSKTPGIRLVDVRSPQEYCQVGHLPQAINYPLEELSSRYNTWFPELDAHICLYCLSGSRSHHAAKWLAKRGYTQIIDLGAITDWRGTLIRSV